jgi:ABC-type multidrug transport system permease subunit
MPDGLDPSAYTDRMALLFYGVMIVLSQQMQRMSEFQNDRLLFYRERATHSYSVFAYWFTIIFINTPINIIGLTLQTIPYYFICGLRGSDDVFHKSFSDGFEYYLFYWGTLLICDVASLATGKLLSNISASMQVAVNIFPIFLMLVASFEGFIIYIPQFPSWLSWVPNIDYVRYAFQALVLNEFRDNESLPFANHYLTNLGFDTLDKYECLCILCYFALALCAVSYYSLYYVNFEKR